MIVKPTENKAVLGGFHKFCWQSTNYYHSMIKVVMYITMAKIQQYVLIFSQELYFCIHKQKSGQVSRYVSLCSW